MRTRDPQPASGLLVPRWALAVMWAALLVIVIGRIVSVFTLNVNWDEFALLQRATTTARTGELVGGGRPGLATLVLLPFAAACRNAVTTVVQARLLWTGIVVAAVVAFWLLLRMVLKPSPFRPVALATGVGLWALAAPVLHTSVEVRTDQPAILFGLLGGLALVTSRRHVAWAALAGVLYGTGFLFSQKAVYVGALTAVLALGEVVTRDIWKTKREAARAVLTAAAFAGLILAYRVLMTPLFGALTILPVTGALATFDHYRDTLEWGRYRSFVPLVAPQIMAMAGLVGLTVAWVRERGRHGQALALAWGVLGVGAAVGWFHAGIHLYFYMVLGLFPATAAAVIVAPVLERLGSPRARRIVLGMIWLPLVAIGLFQVGATSAQAQEHQRRSLEWVERTFPDGASGYHDLGAFACREAPFPVRFPEHLRSDFAPERREASVHCLVAEFRDRPVVFMIPPFDLQFPAELREFWDTRYVHYFGAVHVAGRQVRGGAGWSGAFDALVPGDYAWHASPGSGPLYVEGRRVDPGSTLRLERQGEFSLFLPSGGDGMLVLALPDGPAPDPRPFFR